MTTINMPQEPHRFDVDDFIKTFSAMESPARPTLAHMNGGHYHPNMVHDGGSSPYEGNSFSFGDLSGSTPQSEWKYNAGLDSVLGGGVSTPSSRGSSLETPNMQPTATFMSIDPSRLKDGTFRDTPTDGNSPAWSMPSQSSQTSNHSVPQPVQHMQHPGHHHQRHHQQQPVLTLNTNLSVSYSAPVSAASSSPHGLTPPQLAITPTMECSSTLGQGTKRKRQGSLPDGCIPVQQQTLAPRTFQRSVSVGSFDGIVSSGPPQLQLQIPMSESTSPYMSQASPISGPMSAPPMTHHPQSFAPGGQAPAPGIPSVNVQTANRSFNCSSLATIPEAPNSAPADVVQFPQALQHQQLQQQLQQQVQQYQPDQHQHQHEHQPQQHYQHQHQHHQHHQQPQYQHQHQQVFRYNAGDTYSVQAAPSLQSPANGHSPMITTPSLPDMGRPMTMVHARATSASGIPMHTGNYHGSGGGMPVAYSQAIPTSTAVSLNPNVGMGRPIHTPAHMRRSSDSELAFGMQPNASAIGAMLRSTSVPQVAGQVRTSGSAVYGPGQHLPPPPPVTTYSAHNIVGPYAESFVQTHHSLGYGVPPNGGGSPPRKVSRIISKPAKRVGTCLKPGPKKAKPKGDISPIQGEAIKTESFDGGVPMVSSNAPVHTMRHVGAAAPVPPELASVNLLPVSLEEFCSAFDRTHIGTLIPRPEMEAMTDRLMYATDEAIVEQCFRWCYTIGTEFNKIAEKQSKYFKCCFEECQGSAQRIFMRKSAVDSHVRTHVGFRPYKCEVDPECDARFVRKHDRDRHVSTTHRNEKLFTCDDCAQNFARSDALLRHRAKRDACKARVA